MRKVAQRIALCCAALVCDLFVAAGEGNWLEREERNDLGIIERELDDAADLLVVDAVHDRRDRNDIDARLVEVLDRFQLYVEEIADFAVRVSGIADAIELQVNVAQTRVSSLPAELFAL